MSHLFKILVRHVAPKDIHSSIQGFLIRDSSEEVCDYVEKVLKYRDDDDLLEERELYNEEGDFERTETFRQRLVRLGGEFFDPDADYSDAYYGVTHYGWVDLEEINDKTLEIFKQYDLILDQKEKNEKSDAC